ncbi:MAG: MFS transporter [Thermofilaceae archaeon]
MRRNGLPPPFVLHTLASSFAHALWYTLFPIYLRSLGLPLAEVGLASSLPLTLSFVLALPAGIVADALPARRALILATGGQAAIVALLPSLKSPAVTASLLFSYTFLSTLRGQSSLRVVASRANRSDMGTWYSLYLLASGASAAVGSYLSGVITEREGFTPLYRLSAIAFALSALPLTRLEQIHGSRARERIKLEHLKSAGFFELTLSLSIHDFAVFSVMPYTALFQREILGLSTYEIGTLAALGTVVSQVFQPVAGLVTDRLGSRLALALHYVGVSAGYALMAVSRSYGTLALAVVLQNVFLPLDMPARRKLLSYMAPPSSVATANGLSDAVVGLVAAPSPLLGSFSWSSLGARWAFGLGAALNLLALAPLAKLRERSART